MYKFGERQTAAEPPAIPRLAINRAPSPAVYDEKTGYSTPDADSDKPFTFSYPHHQNGINRIPNKPLIHYINNDWQKNQSTIGTGEEDDDCIPPEWMEIICSRAFKKWMMLYFVVVIGFWLWWFRVFAPKQRASTSKTFLADSLRGRFVETEYGYFGSNRRAEFAGMQHLDILDRALVPGSETSGIADRRLIIVGDIHGCADDCK